MTFYSFSTVAAHGCQVKYTTVLKFGVGKIFYILEKKYLMLTRTAFI